MGTTGDHSGARCRLALVGMSMLMVAGLVGLVASPAAASSCVGPSDVRSVIAGDGVLGVGTSDPVVVRGVLRAQFVERPRNVLGFGGGRSWAPLSTWGDAPPEGLLDDMGWGSSRIARFVTGNGACLPTVAIGEQRFFAWGVSEVRGEPSVEVFAPSGSLAPDEASLTAVFGTPRRDVAPMLPSAFVPVDLILSMATITIIIAGVIFRRRRRETSTTTDG